MYFCKWFLLNKMSIPIKELLGNTLFVLSNKIEPVLQTEFKTRNLNRLLITILIAVPLGLINILLFGVTLSSESSLDMTWRYHIFYAHIALSLFLLVVGITAYLIKTHPSWQKWIFNLFFAVAILGMLFAGATISAFDQYITNAITPFILASVFVSMAFLVHPRKMLIFQIAGIAFFYLINIPYQLKGDVFVSNMVNVCFISGISFILSLLLWNSYVLREIQNTIIKEQKEQLEAQLVVVQQTAQELALANKSKDRFFSIIAHDLRNPIGSIMSLLNLINNKEYADSQTKEQLNELMLELQKAANNTYNLLENLLFWAKEQDQSSDFNPQLIHLQEVIDDAISTASIQIIQKKLTVNIDLTSPDVQVFADNNMLKTIFRNVLGNAIKFSFVYGKILISASENDQMTTIRIEDFGLGIPDANRRLLFSVENNVSTIGTANEKGTGLGLVLCSEFMKRHNGQISIVDKVTEGTIIELKFPKTLI
jgi:signal transduction histidine kinase